MAFIEDYIRQYKDLTTVHYEPKPQKSKLHPTMKPIPLVGRLMNNSSKPGWAVGDFFGGSGTTLMAAEQLGRTAYMMEFEPRNVDVIVKRWETFKGFFGCRLAPELSCSHPVGYLDAALLRGGVFLETLTVFPFSKWFCGSSP